MKTAYLLVPFAPLLGAIIAGFFGRSIGRTLTHWIAILGVLVSLVASSSSSRTCCRAMSSTAPLQLGGGRRPELRGRLPDRQPHRHDDGGGHFRVADGPHLHHRLHGGRRRVHPLFLLHQPVHLLDADAGHVQQLPAAVLRLGSGRTGVVPADRLLVHATHGDPRQPEGIPGQPGRRLRVRTRDRPDRGRVRQPRLCGGVPGRAGAAGRTRSTCWARPSGRSSRSSASACSSGRWASRPSFPCMSGCRIRWRARLRFRP